MLTYPRPRIYTLAVTALVLLLPLRAPAEDAPAQKTFANPTEAVRALASAAKIDNKDELRAILGPGSEDIVASGDPIADKIAGQEFAARTAAALRLETLPSGAVIAHVGKEDWPLPLPVVKDGDRWRFDTAAGREELLNRRVGRNELKAIDVARVYVDAQREYARTHGGAYAQKVRSAPGKEDGLYWDDPDGKHPSPLGPLLAEADAEGYEKPEEGAGPSPYHGYYYRILTAQGRGAPGGARNYLRDGTMTGGFALLAYPADHGASGVMTFIVGPEAIVYQKNLGERTADAVKAITTYDPDDSWTPVRD